VIILVVLAIGTMSWELFSKRTILLLASTAIEHLALTLIGVALTWIFGFKMQLKIMRIDKAKETNFFVKPHHLAIKLLFSFFYKCLFNTNIIKKTKTLKVL